MNLQKYLILSARRKLFNKDFYQPLERHIYKSAALSKTIPDNLKGKSKSSQDWLLRQINDVYVKKSRYHGYRCRSAYKLLEIDEKYNILRPGQSVVDCGAAPGSWTQVVVTKLKLDSIDKIQQNNVVVAVDLQHMDPIKGAIMLQESNFTHPSTQEKILKLLPHGKADVILSDMAPKASGTYDLDCAAIMNLVYNALRFAVITLKKDGTFVCKVWDSRDIEIFMKSLESLFTSVKRVKPKASRMDSAELFLLARGYKCDKVINKTV